MYVAFSAGSLLRECLLNASQAIVFGRNVVLIYYN
jgi:hypothetical protein